MELSHFINAKIEIVAITPYLLNLNDYSTFLGIVVTLQFLCSLVMTKLKSCMISHLKQIGRRKYEANML